MLSTAVYRTRAFAIFGLRIPYLPDFLADHTLLGETESEKLAECCRRWECFVGSLWTLRPQMAFELRYSFDPNRGAIDLVLLGRVSECDFGERVVAAVQRSLALLRVPSATVSLDELTALCGPRAHHAFEIRQAEKLVSIRTPLLADSSDAYLVLPWWGAGGAFLAPMTALAAAAERVELAVMLQPTELDEARALAELAAKMATAAGTPTEGAVVGVERGAERIHSVDPQAQWLGRVHAANHRRLHRPFLATSYVFSNDAVAARGVATALAAAISDEPPFEPPIGEPGVIPSRVDVVELDKHERQAALLGIGDLEFYFAQQPIGAAIDGGLYRLRYLCDARGAATAFRLPVSVRGGVPGIAVHQRSPDFHPGPRICSIPSGHIELGTYEDGGYATVPINDLTKHVLVTGFTGSGKTVTVLQMLHQLWAEPHRIPFLVLESAKQEYRGFLGVPGIGADLRVYTLGNEAAVPFRLNPFELLPGVRVEAHVSRLQVCLEAAVPPIGPSASVIAEAMQRVYEACGWSLTDVYPVNGLAKRRFPRLSEFVAAIEQVISDRKYAGEVESNLTAALVGRFKPLLLGSKSRMLDTPRSSPSAAELFKRPTVLELNDLNVDDKSLLVMFVLTFLREYREQEFRRAGQLGKLAHVTLVEEAHNILENVSSKGSGEGTTAADTRFKAVEAFCQLLTEIRALGEGLVVADQSPEKLAPDAMRNTNLQIAHQLRDGHDREAIANAMIMTDKQRDFLGKLAPGHAAVFRTGLEQATFVRVPKYYPNPDDEATCPFGAAGDGYRSGFRGWGFNAAISDTEVARLMCEREPEVAARKALPLVEPLEGCECCQNKCRHRDAIHPEFDGEEGLVDVVNWGKLLAAEWPSDDLWRFCATTAVRGASRVETTGPKGDAPWCYFVHMWHKKFGSYEPPKVLTQAHYALFHKHLSALRVGSK